MISQIHSLSKKLQRQLFILCPPLMCKSFCSSISYYVEFCLLVTVFRKAVGKQIGVYRLVAILCSATKNGEENAPRALPLEPISAFAVLRKARAGISFSLILTPDAHKSARRTVCK